MRKVLDVIWGERKQEYFCKQDWTGNAPDGQISPVGWVEPFAKPIIFANLQLMGIASLHPSYGPGSPAFAGDNDWGRGAFVLNPSLRANGSRECARPMTGSAKQSILPRKERKNGLLRRSAPRNDGYGASYSAVIPRACGVSSTLRVGVFFQQISAAIRELNLAS